MIHIDVQTNYMGQIKIHKIIFLKKLKGPTKLSINYNLS
jgi:hypothetical protein